MNMHRTRGWACIPTLALLGYSNAHADCATDPWGYNSEDIVNCNSGNVIVGEPGGSLSAKMHLRTPRGVNSVIVESEDDRYEFRQRFVVEHNPGPLVDIDFRNAVVNFGSTNASVSSSVGLVFQAPSSEAEPQHPILVYKPGGGSGGSNMYQAFLMTRTGSMFSYVKGYADNALWVGAFTDPGPEFRITGDGYLKWSDPDTATFDDTVLYRSSAAALTTDGSFTAKQQVSTLRVVQQVQSGQPLVISNPNAGLDVSLETNGGDVRVTGFFQLQVVSSAPSASDCNDAGEFGRSLIQTTSGSGTGSTKLWICGDGGWVSK
jgi:hypothetical protein